MQFVMRAGLALALCGALAVAAVALWSTTARTSVARDRPLAPFTEPGKPARIVAFGSSLTRSNAWPDGLAQTLGTCLGYSVEVIRVARGGADSAWGLKNLPRVLAAQPDLVLMEFAINDADLRDGASLRRARSQHERLIAQMDAGGVPPGRIMLMTMNPVGGQHILRRAFLPRHYAQQVTLAETQGTALADLYADWLALPPERRRFPDGLHPTDADTAGLVVPGLTRRIAAAAGTPCPVPPDA